jgi:hypothetical protein
MAITQVKSKQQFLVTDDVNFQTKKITNLADPVSAQDAATKAYVDAVKQALDIKDSVRAATTANITLSGAQTIDGVSVVAGDRVLVKDQSTASQNGIYVAAAGAWTRAADANISAEVTPGLFVFVEEGTANGDNGYVLTTNAPITLDTTALVFTQFSGAGQIAAGAGLTKTGNTIDVVGTAGRIIVNADSIDLATTAVSANTYGNSGFNVAQITVDAYGRLTAASNRDIFGTSVAQNAVFAGPTSGTGAPSFRALVAADIPDHSTDKLTSGTLGVPRGGTGATTLTGIVIGNGTSAMTAVSSTTALQVLRVNSGGTGYEFATVSFGGGSVTTVSIVSANGFAGSVATPSTTPAITLTTTVTGVLKGNGTAISAAVAGTDYQAPISLTTTGNSGAATFSSNTLNIPNYTLVGLGGFANPMTTLGDTIYGGVSGVATRLAGNITTAKQFLSQTGNGSASAAPAWATIAGSDITGAALTKTDDTNVTLTLGGTPATSLLRAASITVGWTGTLAVGRGGLGSSATPTNGQIPIGNGTNYVAANISGSSTISVTNGSGTIGLAVVTGSTGVVTAPNYVVREVVNETPNGVLTAFTIDNTPIANSEHVYVNGVLMNQGAGNDYTISGATITFQTGAIPQTGDVVLVSYLK